MRRSLATTVLLLAGFILCAQNDDRDRPALQAYWGAQFSVFSTDARGSFVLVQYLNAPQATLEGELFIVQSGLQRVVIADRSGRQITFSLTPASPSEVPVYGITTFMGTAYSEQLLLPRELGMDAPLNTSYLTSLDAAGNPAASLGCGCVPADAPPPCAAGGEGAIECAHEATNGPRANRCAVRCAPGFVACCAH